MLHRADCGKKRDPRGDESDERKELSLDIPVRLKKRPLSLLSEDLFLWAVKALVLRLPIAEILAADAGCLYWAIVHSETSFNGPRYGVRVRLARPITPWC